MEFEVNKIMVVGDVHSDTGSLNELIKSYEPEILIVLGDAGFYWTTQHLDSEGKVVTRAYTGALDSIATKNTKLFWLPGNHENWDYIEKEHGRYALEPIKIKHNIYYCPIGSYITVNGANILFIGGADSVDKNYRKPGVSWWEQEVLNNADLEWLKENSLTHTSFDIVCSHTCPKEFDMQLHEYGSLYNNKQTDPTRDILSSVMVLANPTYWFFGHWHKYIQGKLNDIHWCGLNTITSGYEHGGRSFMDISTLFYTDADVEPEKQE